MVVVCNFTPVVYSDYRIGVPNAGIYHERINTDSAHDGGSKVGAPFGQITADALPWLGKAHSLHLSLPPLATVIFTWQAEPSTNEETP